METASAISGSSSIIPVRYHDDDSTDRFGILDEMYALCSACEQPLLALLSLMDVYRQKLDHSLLLCLIDVAYKVSSVITGDVNTRMDAMFFLAFHHFQTLNL